MSWKRRARFFAYMSSMEKTRLKGYNIAKQSAATVGKPSATHSNTVTAGETAAATTNEVAVVDKEHSLLSQGDTTKGSLQGGTISSGPIPQGSTEPTQTEVGGLPAPPSNTKLTAKVVIWETELPHHQGRQDHEYGERERRREDERHHDRQAGWLPRTTRTTTST